MMTRSIVALTLSAVLLTPEQCESGMTLVEDGRSVAVIVTADQPTPAASRAAADLQMWLQRSSGATVAIRTERDVDPAAKQLRILVGDTKQTRSLGVDVDDLGLEEIVVKTFPGTLVIVGDDQRDDGVPLTGTTLAVSTFAEHSLGVRMLWPGPLGEIVPAKSSITVDNIDIRQKPMLLQRSIGNQGFNGVTHENIKALGWDIDDFKRFSDDSNLWFRFHRLGQSHTGNYGHAFGDYWDRFHKEHPDWFALQPDGTRDNSQPASDGYPSHRLCVSNPGLINQIAQDTIQTLRNQPTLDAAAISPNDGGLQTFCLCETCEAWDAPEGAMIEMRSKNGPITHVSLSDRYVRFFSAVAEIVAQELPDRHVGTYAYAVYTHAPVRAKLHPNVVMGFVPGTKTYFNEAKREELRENWLKWATQSDKLHVYCNGLAGLHALPTVTAHRLADDLRFWADHKMLFAYYDCHYHHWATNGLNYYVVAKLLWDPHLDVDEVIDDFCQAGFSPATETVRTYFNELERISMAIAEERRRPDADTIARHFTDETLVRLSGIFDQAVEDAGDDDIVVQRIEFLRKGLEYAPICRDYLVADAATDEGNKWDWRRYTRAGARRITFYHQLGPSRAIHAPWLIYQDW